MRTNYTRFAELSFIEIHRSIREVFRRVEKKATIFGARLLRLVRVDIAYGVRDVDGIAAADRREVSDASRLLRGG